MSKPDNQAVWHGFENVSNEDLEWFNDKLKIGMGASSDTFNWKNKEIPFATLIDQLSTHVEGPKDGICFMQGDLIPDTKGKLTRKRASVRELNILALDIDHGAPIDEIIKEIKKQHLFAIIYTSHSHMKDESQYSRDDVFKQLAIADAKHPLDGDDMYEYLTVHKGIDPRIVENIVVTDVKQTSEGVKVFTEHAPMPKYRAIFILTDPFRPAEEGFTHKDGMEKWAKKYAGVAELLNTKFDRSCTDVSRLFYMPRHAPGAPYETHVIFGDCLELESIEDGDPRPQRIKPKTGIKAVDNLGEHFGSETKSEEDWTPGLKRFFAKYGGGFRIADYFESLEEVREEKEEGKLVFECPFDAGHSNAEDETDVAFCTWNPGVDGKENAAANCQHDSCREYDRIDFVNEMMIRYDHSLDDLMEFVDKDGLDTGASAQDLLDAARREMDEDEDDDDDDDERSDKDIVDKLLEGVNDKTGGEKLEEAIKVIVSAEISTVDYHKSLDAIKEKTGMSQSSLNKVVKEIKQVIKKESLENGPDVNPKLEKHLIDYNKKFAAVVDSGKMMVIEETKQPVNNQTFISFNTKDFKDFYQNDRMSIPNGDEFKEVQIASEWMKWSKRRSYKLGFGFYPSDDETLRGLYNTWKGFPVKPAEGNCDKLLNHIMVNLCRNNQEHYNYLMTYFAHIFQHPDKLPGVMISISGSKGTGKSFLVETVLGKLLEGYISKTANIDDVFGQFNNMLGGSLVCVLEEATWGGDKKHEGQLKDIITSSDRTERIKFRNTSTKKNFLRLISITNEDFHTPATQDERRFFVLKMADTRRQDTDYFGAIAEQLENGGYEAFMNIMLQWPEPKIGWVRFLFDVPKTEGLQEQVRENTSPEHRSLVEALAEGYIKEDDRRGLPFIDFTEKTTVNDDTYVLVDTDDIHAHWKVWCTNRYKNTKSEMVKTVNKLIGAERSISRSYKVNGKAKKHLFLPPHEELCALLVERGVMSADDVLLEGDDEETYVEPLTRRGRARERITT